MLGGTVEFFPVNGGASIVCFDDIGILRFVALTFFDHLVSSPLAVVFTRPFLAVSSEKLLTVGFVFLGEHFHFLLFLGHRFLLFLPSSSAETPGESVAGLSVMAIGLLPSTSVIPWESAFIQVELNLCSVRPISTPKL